MKSIKRLLLTAMMLLPAVRAGAAPPSPFVKLFDIRPPSAAGSAAEALMRRDDRARIAAEKRDHTFVGDAVFANDKLGIVLPRKGAGAVVCTFGPDRPRQWAVLTPAGGRAGPARRLTGLRILENTPAAVALEATFASEKGTPLTVSYRLTTGVVHLETRPGKGATSLLVYSTVRHLVVPEFFGDDMVFGSGLARGPRLPLPAENCLIGLAGGGDALLITTWPSHRQNAAMALMLNSGWILVGWEIDYLPGKGVHFAVLNRPGIWHSRYGKAAVKPGARPWKPPFSARWRRTAYGRGGVGRSGDLAAGPPATSRPTAGLVIYPLDRDHATPLPVFTAMDVFRNTLGVGPCQYILAAEGIGGETPATTDFVTHWIERLFERKRAKGRADEIKERLDQMVEHVRRSDARIGRYRGFTARIRKVCEADGGGKGLLPILGDIDRLAAPRAGAPPQQEARRIARAMVALVGGEGAMAQVRKLGAEARAIGAAQDRAIANSRMAVRRLRQRCRFPGVAGGPTAGLAAKVLKQADEMLSGEKAKGESP